MVWFQCEDCGDNLKKPKLPSHFRICCATKLSCIDCGKVFGQESVLGHTQCMTEMEKYGPKGGQGQGKGANGAAAKPNKDGKQQPDFDITVGLSEWPPWFCSLCNTNATSKQTLLLHAEGKKHKARARAFHAAQQKLKKTEESAPETKPSSENPQKGELLDKKDVEEPQVPDINFKASNGSLPSNKKRKSDKTDDDNMKKKNKDDVVALGNGEVIQCGNIEAGKTGSNIKQDEVQESCPASEETLNKIKWKKIITSALKSSPDGVIKMKKLRKTVLKALQESGITVDEDQFKKTIEHKINSSSRFTVDNKDVRLVAKD
ncbi:UBP1-associated proteins 1C [Humulus lupulus]|uniref:UBP1-associated proteins 1C n=1 Tax=Humulus lupulus TaxID=3486 RepID=UPI002B40BA56|nr:UBP1-associated proteins 1C [Humulus lupulus]